MEPTTAFLSCLAALAALAAGVVLFLRRPLERLLTELCGGAERARFWARTYYASLVLGTLFAALLAPPDAIGRTDLIGCVPTLRAGFFGLLGALGVLALVALRFLLRADERNTPRPHPRSLAPFSEGAPPPA